MTPEERIAAMMQARDRERIEVDLMRLRLEAERDELARQLAEARTELLAELRAKVEGLRKDGRAPVGRMAEFGRYHYNRALDDTLALLEPSEKEDKP